MSSMRPEKPEAVPLYYAAALGFRDLAEHLIAEHPEHINARGGREVTPMHAAALAGHADLLSLLLDRGADLDGRGTFVWTPPHRASWNGELEAGKCLLDCGADVNTRDEDGPRFSRQCSTDISTLLGCCLDAGRGSMRMTALAVGLRCTVRWGAGNSNRAVVTGTRRGCQHAREIGLGPFTVSIVVV
jgi:hypothetical protein